MKVWVLLEYTAYEGAELLGIYHEESRANEEAVKAKAAFKKRFGSPREAGKSWETHEWEVE